MELMFEWDEGKNSSNIKNIMFLLKKQKLFFFDDFARVIFDPDHSEHEDRFIILVVVHCYRESDSVIRIISARRATNNEKRQYKEYLL